VSAERQSWTADARYIVVNQWRAAITTGALASLGAFAFWAKVLTVADERRRVRRTLLETVKVLWRAPIRALLAFVVVTVAVQGVGAYVLASAASHGGGALTVVSFALFIALHMGAWHALMQYGRIFYGDARFDDIRGRGDDPLGVWAWVKRRVLRR
jgi:hypothetical protein